MIIICNSIRRKFLLVDMRFESENEQIRLGYSPTKIIWLMENCLGNTWILIILTQKPQALGKFSFVDCNWSFTKMTHATLTGGLSLLAMV